MGLIFRRRIPLARGLALNVSKSGVSASARKGPVTLNSRGQVRVRLAKGISFRL